MGNLTQKLENIGFKKFGIRTYRTESYVNRQVVYYRDEDADLIPVFRKTWSSQRVYFVSKSFFQKEIGVESENE